MKKKATKMGMSVAELYLRIMNTIIENRRKQYKSCGNNTRGKSIAISFLSTERSMSTTDYLQSRTWKDFAHTHRWSGAISRLPDRLPLNNVWMGSENSEQCESGQNLIQKNYICSWFRIPLLEENEPPFFKSIQL